MTTHPSINIAKIVELPTPADLEARIPITPAVSSHVEASRKTVADIVLGREQRLLVIVGPCSIHCADTAIDYAERLNELAKQISDNIFIVMRTYFEKPRTGLGWKGMIYDPDLNGTHDISQGVARAREVLMHINALGLPCATEWLDPLTPQYLGNLISWSAIGARTVESQTHRQMASGISAPIGFKNSTSGDIKVAVTAAMVARKPQTFIGIASTGKAAAVSTKGNSATHIVLRGGHGVTNYDRKSVQTATKLMLAEDLKPSLLVDCSHGNSNKDHTKQPFVFNNVLEQYMEAGQQGLVGMMLESNINAGSQKFGGDQTQLKYGVSITDSCMDWQTTKSLLLETAQTLTDARSDT